MSQANLKLTAKSLRLFPVISISLKDIDAGSYGTAFQMAVMLIYRAAGKHQYLLDSEKLT